MKPSVGAADQSFKADRHDLVHGTRADGISADLSAGWSGGGTSSRGLQLYLPILTHIQANMRSSYFPLIAISHISAAAFSENNT